MRLRSALAPITLAFLTACGSSGGKVYSISTGTYSMDSVSAVAPDNCNLAATFPDGTLLGVTVDNGTATFRPGNEAANPTRNPVSTISENTIAEGTKTYDAPFDATCTETITVTVSGEILADNQFNGTIKYASQAASGSTGCTPALLQYKAFPCASTMTFLGKKQ